MMRLARNVRTILQQPTIAFEYANWLLQSRFKSEGPVRELCGVKLGEFNGFSEFHSLATCVSPEESSFLMRHPFGDGAIIDIGANLGLFALTLNNRFPDRRIVAFEPVLSTYTALKANVARNGAKNVECHQSAVADVDGEVGFAAKEDARANSAISGRQLIEAGSAMVPCTTLDSFVSGHDIGRIALLKVDVEGYELLVFRGAEKILSEVRPNVVYFEVCPILARRAGFDAAAAARYLSERSYSLHRVRSDGSLSEATVGEVYEVSTENWVGIDIR